MKILGIVGSCRRLGNTEILVKEALLAAREMGAEADIVRWTDFKILPCDGDANCLFLGKDCKYQSRDDHDFLLKMMYGFDGIIFGAPCYILEVESVVKQFMDRLFILFSQPSQLKGKPAAIITPYGTRGWTPYAFLQPTILMQMLGMDIIDKTLVHIQAISQAAGDSSALQKARRTGIEVVKAIQSGDHSYKGDPGICPVCHERNIRILKDNETVECGICAVRGKLTIENGKIQVNFPQEQLKRHRFSTESIDWHVKYDVKPSKDFFMKIWPALKEQRKKYKDFLDIDKHVIEAGRARSCQE
ncbi:MAG: flavodoxin family protein [Dehalococcoidia bacterium]|nr:flavodoxin family protein [Dehalococcoidia bacterium]